MPPQVRFLRGIAIPTGQGEVAGHGFPAVLLGDDVVDLERHGAYRLGSRQYSHRAPARLRMNWRRGFIHREVRAFLGTAEPSI